MKLTPLAAAIALLGLATAATAQNTPQRVEITGSSIKRIADEGALPLQIIRAEDMARAGITSTEQLIQSLSANGNGVDNMVSNQGGDFLNSLAFSGRGANNGASSASLRGLSPQNTLVLLNGRRISPHGLNGKSVDLNTIPFAALDRVEVLKDGASAIYGTDAIGGVINFILKRDFTGLELGTSVDITEAGGGNIYNANVLFGAGSLDKTGFNFMANLSFSKQDRLRGTQRDFHDGYQPERGLAMDTTGTPYANVVNAAGTAIPASWTIPGTTTRQTRFNPLAVAGNCETIDGQVPYRADITGFNNARQACAYDYGRDWSLQQPVERLNLVARGTLKLGANHTGLVEVTASRVTSDVQYTPNQLTTLARGAEYPVFRRDINGNVVRDANGNPVPAPYYLDLTGQVPGFDKTKPIRVRWRCVACGFREQSTETDTYRVLLGMEGTMTGWDYRWGLSTAASKANTDYTDGYFVESKLKAVMDTGLVNFWLKPGEKQTQEAMDLIESAKYRGPLYGGEAKLTQFDLVASREMFKLPGGMATLALGTDLRRESFQFSNGNDGLVLALIGAGSPDTLPTKSRTVKAVFGELALPIVKGLEAQVAVRHDSYSDFGESTNPKVALRWQPIKQMVVRGSYNTGFHAPDFGPLYERDVRGQFNSDVDDPVFCPTNPGNAEFCKIRPLTRSGGNPDLKPERSKQFTLGFVIEPSEMFSASVDFFQTEIKDRITTRTPQEVLANFATLGDLIVRNPTTNVIEYVRAGWVNAAGDKVKGVDLNLTFNLPTSMGRFTAKIDGTYLDSYKVRKTPGDPWVERVGEFGDSTYLWDLKLRWKHTASVSWSQGPWNATLTQLFSSGYKEEVNGYGSGLNLQNLGFQSRISDYTLYNVSVTYTGIKNLTLSAGIKNLLNTDPPFSLHNVDNVAGAGWDARVGDPRGRAYTLRATYRF
ncbi:MAG: TonB-dependent receptor [Rubrivivax sp.]|nr:TonB-dependent receptor [Rubrivivax sp.]